MKYLVIQTRDIGDVLLSTSLCSAIKRAHAGAEVHFLTMDYCAGVVYGNPSIDEVVVIERAHRNKVGYMRRFLAGVRRADYDVILNVQGQLIGLFCCLASRSSRRVGFDRVPWRWAHTEVVPLGRRERPTGHGGTLDDRFELLERLGIETDERSYAIALDDSERERGRQLLQDAGANPAQPIVVLGVNARDDYKRWPLAYFAQVAEWLIRTQGAQCYVPFGPGEQEYSQQLRGRLPEDCRERLFDNVQTASIRELAMVFANCTLYIGNDTGPRHIAQALDLPAFAIVSPSSNKWDWIPWDHPRFRAVDTGDALEMSREDWRGVQATIQPGVNDGEWFVQLGSEFVLARVGAMAAELSLFPALPTAAAHSQPESPSA